jgi:hypothetical protein
VAINGDSTIGQLRSYALFAFENLGKGSSKEALNALKSAESIVVSARDLSDSLQTHLRLWVLLVSGSVLNDLAQYDEAILRFDEVRSFAEKLEHKCSGYDFDCFSREWIQASIYLARSNASLGRFNSAIATLVKIPHSVPTSNHSFFSRYNEEIAQLIEGYGGVLGYLGIKEKLKTKIESTDTTSYGQRHSRPWSSPIPIDGPINAKFEDELREVDRRFAQIEERSQIDQLRYLIAQQRVLDVWVEGCPCSVNVRSNRTRILLQRATLEVKSGRIGEFQRSWSDAMTSVEELEKMAPDVVDFHRMVQHGLLEFSLALLSRQNVDEVQLRVNFDLARVSLSDAITQFEHSRMVSPVTQAIALETVMTLDILAKVFDALGKKDLADHQRIRRDMMLTKVLDKDPHNDSALRLSATYSATGRIGSRTERAGIAIEIGSWNWSIIPVA